MYLHNQAPTALLSPSKSASSHIHYLNPGPGGATWTGLSSSASATQLSSSGAVSTAVRSHVRRDVRRQCGRQCG